MINKKIFTSIFLIMAVLTLNACSSKSSKQPTAESVTSKIVEDLQSDTMIELSEERVQSYYGFDLDIVEDYSIYVDGSGGFSDEVAVLKAKDTGDINALKDSIQERVDSQEKAFDGYNAKEFKKLEDHLVVVRDNYVLFVVSNDTESAQKIFRNAFN